MLVHSGSGSEVETNGFAANRNKNNEQTDSMKPSNSNNIRCSEMYVHIIHKIWWVENVCFFPQI